MGFSVLNHESSKVTAAQAPLLLPQLRQQAPKRWRKQAVKPKPFESHGAMLMHDIRNGRRQMSANLS